MLKFGQNIYTVDTRYKRTRYKRRRAISGGRCWDKRAQYKMFPQGLDISVILAIRVKRRQNGENAYIKFKIKHQKHQNQATKHNDNHINQIKTV